jgi:hypothetical protein
VIDETAILITAFNRPVLLQSLLESLRNSRISVYLSIDAAKAGDLKNQELVAQCHEVASDFSTLIVEIRSPEVNQGCFLGVSKAISWGFSKASRLIILEDDILPAESFLQFASQMLIEFQDTKTVGSIGGTNLVPDDFIRDADSPYRFSAFTTSWGWATWFDRWMDYERDLTAFPELGFETPNEFWNPVKRHYWSRLFRATSDGAIDTWDYRWLYSNWKNNRLTVIPNANLVLNVGFGNEATHTRDTPWWLPTVVDGTYKAEIETQIPIRDVLADQWMEANHFRTTFGLQLRSEISRRFPRIANTYRTYLKK